jgi:hypothetical protein
MRKRLLLAGLVLLLAIPLIFVVRDFVRDVLLIELLRLIWTVRILLDSLPQVLVWSVFLLILLNVAVRSLLAVRRISQGRSESLVEPVGQVQFLAIRIRSSARGDFYAWNLVRYLGRLVADVLAYDQGTTSDRTAWLVRSGKFRAPDEVREYLQIGRTTQSVAPRGFLSRLVFGAKWLLGPSSGTGARASLAPNTRPRQRLGGNLQPHPSDPSLESVIRFLEEKLED